MEKERKITSRLLACIQVHVLLGTLLTTVFLSCSAQIADNQKSADWTILVYAQANNNLHQYAEKNFTDMATIGSASNVNVLVEWHQPAHEGAWRYKIDQGKMTFDACVATDSDGNNPQDLINSMQWAVSKYPAKKTSLVLWNHGCGILDPVWGKYRPWKNQTTPDDKPVTKSNKKTKGSFPFFGENPVEPITRGILFNEETKTYMDNQQLSYALSQIKSTVLNGKKIDLLGMDACLMAMVEVGYQAKNYADIFVASEEVELAHGWHYSSLLELLKNETLSPIELAQGIVLTYEKFYRNKVKFFTQSAVNLNNMDALKNGLDNVVTAAKKCKDAKMPIGKAIKKARAACQQFSASSYIDLHSFLTEFQKNLTTLSHNHLSTDLKKSITSCMGLIDNAIIAHTEGERATRAKGLSIYFPTTGIDASYIKTDFAQESLWLKFLHELSA